MLIELTAAFVLLAVCVSIHATGLAYILTRLSSSHERADSTLAVSWLLIRTAWMLAALHIVEILIWAGFYAWRDCVPDMETAVYFSGVSYVTLGYGDILLPRKWWFLGPMEGLTGILVFGLSTGLFFAMASRVFTRKLGAVEGSES